MTGWPGRLPQLIIAGQVLVGRNNMQNDELSHRVAKQSDVWMHVRGFPGAHTLLQVFPPLLRPQLLEPQMHGFSEPLCLSPDCLTTVKGSVFICDRQAIQRA